MAEAENEKPDAPSVETKTFYDNQVRIIGKDGKPCGGWQSMCGQNHAEMYQAMKCQEERTGFLLGEISPKTVHDALGLAQFIFLQQQGCTMMQRIARITISTEIMETSEVARK